MSCQHRRSRCSQSALLPWGCHPEGSVKTREGFIQMFTIPLNAIGSPAFIASSFFSIHYILYTHFQSGSARVDTGIENGNGYARSIVLRMLLEEASSTSLRFRKQRVHRKLNRPDIHDLTKLYYNNINRLQGTCITSPRGGTWAGTICMRTTHFGVSHVRVDL